MNEPGTESDDETALAASRTAPPEQGNLLGPALRQTANMEALPYTAHDLIEVIGLQATIDLVGGWGGGEIVVPATRGNSRLWFDLVEHIGEVAAGKLVDSRYGGTPVYVPTCTAALRAERDRLIVNMLRQGQRIDHVRRKFRLTRSAVYRIFKRATAA